MRDAALGVLMLINFSTPPIGLAVLVPLIADSRPRANRPRIAVDGAGHDRMQTARAIGGPPAAKSG